MYISNVRVWRRMWWVTGMLVACRYPAIPAIGDAANGDDDAMRNDADGPELAFVPLHLTAGDLQHGAPDLVVTSPLMIDTTALTLDGATNEHFVLQGGNAVLYTRSFFVESPIIVQGSASLIVIASKAIHIESALFINATGPASGPGAVTTGQGGNGGTITPDGSNDERSCGGGGGGGYGTVGALGGDSSGMPGSAGTIFGAGPADLLAGGSPGGAGGNSTNPGGGGGGALQLTSGVEIAIADVTINAGGGGGPRGGPFEGGSGGGAGGEILLEAPAISIAGFVAANGGGGGGGGNGGGALEPTAGGDGQVAFAAAVGGQAGIPRGSVGGAGAYNEGPTLPQDATQGDHNGDMAGGGGGGQGAIWLRAHAATPPNLAGGRFTPPPQLDTLPP